MFENPFSPVFGGKPNLFFGRESILNLFDSAMANQGSEARGLFLTGSRGYGKTALIEQLSIRARRNGRKVIDVGPDNPIGNIMRHLFPFDESAKTIDPEIEVSVLGAGGKLRGGSYTRTTHYDNDDFTFLFLDLCERENPKIFLSIDEIQKVSLDDVSVICNTFQLASRKGYDVMLAVAGLPASYDEVIQHDGCTFLRRGERKELGPFSYDEVRNALKSIFEGIRGIDVDAGALDALAELSKGHPYIMQLEGYHLIESVNKSAPGRTYVISAADVEEIRPRVLASYSAHATRPLLEGMPRAEAEYLGAMARVMDGERVARTADIAHALGKKLSQTSMARSRALSDGVVVSPGQGELIFAIPYLADYLLERNEAQRNIDAVRAWKM